MLNAKTVSFLLLFSFTCVTTFAQSGNLVVNGSFETPGVTGSTPYLDIAAGSAPSGFGWQVTSGTVDIVVAPSAFASTAFDGSQFLDLDGYNPGAIAQSFATTAGTEYILSFAYANNFDATHGAAVPANATVSVVDSVSGAQLITPLTVTHGDTTTANPDWTPSGAISFVAQGTTTTLSFVSNDPGSSNGGIFLDGISVTLCASGCVAPSPRITSVSPISTQQNQTITIMGSGFGTQAPYTGNSAYIALFDVTTNWQAGNVGCLEGPCENDAVTLIVQSWQDSEIVLGGFSGAWGSNIWTLNKGDEVQIDVWNAQSASGPASITTTVVGTQAPQTITFPKPGNVTFGVAPFTISATASSNLTVGFASTTPLVCTVAGNTVTILAAGTCSITASQAGNANYRPAPSVPQSFTVTPASQTITFPQPGNVTLGVAPFTIVATASSSLTVSFASNTPLVCTVAGNTVTVLAAGTCSITASQSGNANYMAATPVTQTFTVSSPTPLKITSSGALGEFLPGAGISNTPTATGGQTPYNWSETGLPGGFSFNSATGAFSGTATTPGVYSFTLKVSDSASTPATAVLTISFSVFGITTSALPAATTTSAYSQQIVAAGGTAPYSFAAKGLPQGLSLSTSGLLSGTPSTDGTFPIAVQVKDATGLSTSANFSLVVTGSPQPLSVSGGSMPNGTVGSSYSSNVTATGGAPPYTWTLTGGSLPDGGVTLSSSGAITGTPRTPGTYVFTVLVADTAGSANIGTFTITIAPATLELTSVSSFPLGNANSPYPLQILSASGGAAPYTFSISNGSLPAGLTLSSPQISGTPTAAGTSGFRLTVTDSAGSTASASASITISPQSANLILSASTVPLSLTLDSFGVPTPASVTVQSSEVMQILNYSVAVGTASPWLDVTTGTATTPGSISIALDPSALSLGASDMPYQASINVTCIAPSPCAGLTQTIVVSLTVTAPSPQLTLTSSLITFNALTSNPGPQSQPLGIQNTGGGTLNITSVTPADSWLTVTGVPSTLAAGPAVSMTVTANSTGLSANFYQSTITVVTSNGTIVVPVTLSVAQSATMTLAPSGATIQSVAGNPPGSLTGSFNVNVTGSGSINWSATVQPGSPWLSVSTPSGIATTATPGTVDFAIDPTLAAGTSAQPWAGSIEITSSTVVDSPLVFQLFLNVNPAGTPPSPQPASGGFVFTSGGGGETPAAVRASGATPSLVSSQTVPIYASSKTPVAYQASAATANGGTWLSVGPSIGSASASTPGQSVISTNAAGLAPGVYRGGVTYAFSSNAVSTVNITLLVGTQGASGSSAASVRAATAAAGCTPTKLVATQTGLVDNFAQPAGWPLLLAVAVNDDCLNTVTNAQVTLTFSNGDPPQVMTFNNSSQTYIYTWTPLTVGSQVTVTGLATAQSLASAAVQITGEVRPNNPPILNTNTPTHVWNPVIGGSLAPGSIVSIYGSHLAADPVPSTGPLGTNLGQTSVLIGGASVPLYYVSPGQINAQVPFELTPGNQYQVIVVANGVPTATPATIQLTPAAPGIATYSTGEVIAQHQADYSLVTDASPAVPGEYLIFYLAGLGATDNPVATGQPASSNPLSHALVPLALTLNGNPVTTAFVGLTPTAVGLYQVDFQVPMGTPNGDLKLVVSQSGLPSNSTILPVHQ
jgi:uncharacterized protein (TIGR03437 family)